MKRENQTYARTLNRRLKGWDNEGLESNLVKETRENLEMFYDKYDIEWDSDFFASNLDLTPEQEKEYEEIMDAFGDMAGSNINEMKRAWEERKDEYEEMYNVESFEDFINFTDQMKLYENDAVMRSVISSSQIAELYSVSSEKAGFSPAKADKVIQTIYDVSGNTLSYNTLYNEVLRAIKSYDTNTGRFTGNFKKYNKGLI